MNEQIIKLTAVRSDRQSAARPAGVSYQRHLAAPRALFAAPPVDLLTLVIAEAVKRRAQAEIQREALRDAMYEMPVAPDRHHGYAPDINPLDADE
ncbi:MAG TPA: hypothetical protein VF534_19345 [Paraburkholderia sp.]